MLLKLGDDALGEALARVPLDSHDALGATCKQLRKIVKSDNFGALRRQLGWTEYGVFVLAGISQESFERKDKYGQYDQSDDAFFCMTHKSDVAQPPRLFYDVGHKQLSVASCEEKGILIASGDANNDGENLSDYDLQVYDIRARSWLPVGSPTRTMPAHLPVEMTTGICLAFVNGQLVVAGDPYDNSDGSCFGWDEALRLWEKLPPMLFPADNAAHAVVESRLYVIGGYIDELEPNSAPCTQVQIYDAETRSWLLGQSYEDLNRRTARPNPPLHWPNEPCDWPREWSVCTWRGKVYIVGCEHGYQPWLNGDQPQLPNGREYRDRDLEDFKFYGKYTEVHCYDPASDQWTEIAPILFTSGEQPQICVHNDRLVVFGHNRPYLSVDVEQQYIWWHELKDDRNIDLEYALDYAWDCGVSVWSPWDCQHWERFGQSSKSVSGFDHPAAHHSVQFRGQGAVSLPLR